MSKLTFSIYGLSSLLVFSSGLFNLQQAAASERVLFENDHVRLMEVTHLPGETFTTPAQKLPAIVAVDAAQPEISIPSSAKQTSVAMGNRGIPPLDRPYPWCQVQASKLAQKSTVKGDFALHYYRMEYKRIDGDAFAANWQKWYPWVLQAPVKKQNLGTQPQPGEPYSRDFPYPIVYDALTAAPANHFLRYRDDHVELVEVFIRPGESENFHGHPLSSVFFDDGGGFYPAIEATNNYLNPDTPLPRGAVGNPPAGSVYPSCYGAIPQWPHSVTVTGKVPQHFFRLQFRRMDGEDIRQQWRQLYAQPKSST